MPLPRPVPPPVMRTRFACRRSFLNMRESGDWEIEQLKIAACQFSNYPITKLHNDSITRDPKPVICILELRRDAGPGGAASHLDVMTPRTSAGGLARGFQRTLFWTVRIALGRGCVVIGIVPVAAPFVDVIANVVEPECVWGILRDQLGPGLPTHGIVGQRLGRIVAPRKLLLLQPSAGGKLPLCFGGKPEGASGLRAQPLAIADGIVPRGTGDRLLRMIEFWIIPEQRRQG